ncbi:MAG TPA: bifunctional YncE family protein/alkaline phosphatase family protein [Candidatus Saccharimonadales bacterium]|nr:bifunctional YncE family protein/alkaline phosphatase family protein [Candidatus Saccharimonadales bacterium]
MSRIFRSAFFLTLLGTLNWSCSSDPRFYSSSGAMLDETKEHVGPAGNNRFVTPANQLITPAGLMVELPGMRPQVLALSPDHKLLVTSGKTAEIVAVDPATGKIIQRIKLPAEPDLNAKPDAVSGNILAPDKEGQVSYTGLVFSPDGSRLYLANVDGSVKVFSVDKSRKISPAFIIPLPEVQVTNRKTEIPSGLAVSRDGRKVYVALNLSNRLGEFDAGTGRLLRTWDVGVAPFDVLLSGSKAYVSNWGGRRPGAGDLTGPAGRGTVVRVDPVRHIASEGSVTVINLTENKVTGEIITGLHASAMALSPNGQHLVVANAASDTLSVIRTATDTIVETIWTRQTPADLFGAAPNALAFDRTGRKLFVCNGSQNAVAIVSFQPGESRLEGLVPVGWYPGAIVHGPGRNSIYVANIKGIGSTKKLKQGDKPKFTSNQYFGTLSLVRVPNEKLLASMTEVALRNFRHGAVQAARQPPRPNQPARPVPERSGEPSLFQHVVYIIKENRTYDQVLGDIAQGNGNASLCVFGERITPNQHKLVKEFVLLDNTYCSGIVSADGHQWADTGITTDYMERSFAGFPRSYPDGMEDHDVDALAYSPAGFIWDNALAHGKTLRDYGEFAITDKSWKEKGRKGKIKFLDHYREFKEGTKNIQLSSRPAIESLRPYMNTNTVGWDMNVPDVFRAAEFIKDLNEFERTGTMPNFLIICLPNDHTSGTAAGAPTPAAQVADNDLAFGQIVEALSHSKFWKETCVFVIEDDPQAGWDHVSGFRTTAYVASPYTKRGEVVSTQYNQTSLLRTMELILGLPPMNQLDASATPMFDCFTSTPNLTPFVALTNNVPLDQMNPEPKKISDNLLRRNAYASARLPLEAPDKCPEDLLNRILWHAMKGSREPYPEWAVTVTEDKD